MNEDKPNWCVHWKPCLPTANPLVKLCDVFDISREELASLASQLNSSSGQTLRFNGDGRRRL